EVGVARVDGHHGEAGGPEAFGPLGIELATEAGEAFAEEPMEVDVADVARVVVAGDHHLGRLDLPEPLSGLLELPFVAGRGEVPGHHDDVGLHAVDALHDRGHHLGLERELADVDVADLGDPEGDAGDVHSASSFGLPYDTGDARPGGAMESHRVSHSLVKALRAVPDFADLDDATLLRIVGASTNLFYPGDGIVFEPGSPAEALYVVLSGEVRIFDREHGNEVEI